MPKKIFSIILLAVVFFTNKAFAQLPVKPLTDQKTMLHSKDQNLTKNKKLVYDMWRTILEAGHLELVDLYLADSYMQHNPNVPTGKKAFVDFFSQFAKAQPIADTIKGPLVALVAEGNLVTLSFARELADPNDPTRKYTTTWFDMFRIENGKIAEHWDSAEVMKKQ